MVSLLEDLNRDLVDAHARALLLLGSELGELLQRGRGIPLDSHALGGDITFDAAHNLPRYNGKCERLHGHTFRVKVTVKAPLDNWSGMAFDFGDIKEIRSSRIVQVGFEKKEPVIGRLHLDGSTARVTTEAGVVEFPRDEILTLIVGEPKELNYWSFSASVGGNIRSGNTDQVDYTARLGAQRRTLRNRIGFE